MAERRRARKRTRQCQAPAVTSWTVCRFHGARGGGPKGARNGAYKHGQHTAEAVAERREMSALLRRARAGIAELLQSSPALEGKTSYEFGQTPNMSR